ncbi:hypothetical protein EDD86DRAFT_206661 [Gorgonomyces haynaldii]|nr:hypothetical protein EDD86DRAFT_206661 [Gorgonomyces haynaldii]
MHNLFNFDHQFVKYGEFHANKVNQAIHLIFVPLILWTAQVWFSNTPSFGSVGPLPINGNLIGTFIYAAYYISLWPLVGTMYLPILIGMSYSANNFNALTDLPLGLTPVAAASLLHVTSWVFQIMGHQVFEKRAPAFTKDPVQALVLAPLFVFLEGLFAIGLFPRTRARLDKKINEAVLRFRQSSKKSQ